MTTTISNLPKDLEERMTKRYICDLLDHKRRPYATGKFIKNRKGMILEEIIWVCNICDNQRKNK